MQSHTFSTARVLSIGRRCVEKRFSFEWLSCSLSPTLTTPEGVIVTLVSRDCCPYLDDSDPRHSVAAAAVLDAPTQPKKTASWDQGGPLRDRPNKTKTKNCRILRRRNRQEPKCWLKLRPRTRNNRGPRLGSSTQQTRKLNLHGTNEILHRLQDVKVVRSAGKSCDGRWR